MDPRVAGAGLTQYGEHPERTGRDLFAEAGRKALAEAGVDPGAVGEVFYGNFMGELAEDQGHQGPLAAEAVGVDAPATRFENACASSGAAVRAAVRAVRSGVVDIALAGGAERMTNRDTAENTKALSIAADALYEGRAGLTFPGAYALMQRAYVDTFGGTREQLAHIAAKNHDNARENPHAQFDRAVTVEEALEAPMVADPIGLYDACPVTDGASAVVLVADSVAGGLETPVRVTGTGGGSDRLALQDRESLVRTPATAAAAEAAYADAGVTPAEVDVAEVHDCFTIAEVLALESLGFYDHGEAVTAARDGDTHATGSLPVNVSGGLKAKGHPVGATGAAQVAFVTTVLRGESAWADAVGDARVGVAHNAGGTVASATVTVLEVRE